MKLKATHRRAGERTKASFLIKNYRDFCQFFRFFVTFFWRWYQEMIKKETSFLPIKESYRKYRLAYYEPHTICNQSTLPKYWRGRARSYWRNWENIHKISRFLRPESLHRSFKTTESLSHSSRSPIKWGGRTPINKIIRDFLENHHHRVAISKRAGLQNKSNMKTPSAANKASKSHHQQSYQAPQSSSSSL